MSGPALWAIRFNFWLAQAFTGPDEGGGRRCLRTPEADLHTPRSLTSVVRGHFPYGRRLDEIYCHWAPLYTRQRHGAAYVSVRFWVFFSAFGLLVLSLGQFCFLLGEPHFH